MDILLYYCPTAPADILKITAVAGRRSGTSSISTKSCHFFVHTDTNLVALVKSYHDSRSKLAKMKQSNFSYGSKIRPVSKFQSNTMENDVDQQLQK